MFSGVLSPFKGVLVCRRRRRGIWKTPFGKHRLEPLGQWLFDTCTRTMGLQFKYNSYVCLCLFVCVNSLCAFTVKRNPPFLAGSLRSRTGAGNRNRRNPLTLQSLLFWKKARVFPQKSKGFSLRGTPKILGKERKNAQKSKDNRKTKKARKSKKARIGGSGPFFPKPKAEPEPPEPFSRNRNRNRNRPFLLNCTQTKKKLFCWGTAGTENRNRSNRSTRKP